MVARLLELGVRERAPRRTKPLSRFIPHSICSSLGIVEAYAGKECELHCNHLITEKSAGRFLKWNSWRISAFSLKQINSGLMRRKVHHPNKLLRKAYALGYVRTNYRPIRYLKWKGPVQVSSSFSLLIYFRKDSAWMKAHSRILIRRSRERRPRTNGMLGEGWRFDELLEEGGYSETNTSTNLLPCSLVVSKSLCIDWRVSNQEA